MTDGLLVGAELGAIMLAAAVLIAFVFLRPERRPCTPRCHFCGLIAIVPDGKGMVEIGGSPCLGEPEYRYIYLAGETTGLQVRDMVICGSHLEQAKELLAALEQTCDAVKSHG